MHPAVGHIVTDRLWKLSLSDSAEDDPVERLKNHFNAYQLTIYDIVRTKNGKATAGICQEANLKDIFLTEMLMTAYTVYYGKVKRMADDVYLVRDSTSVGSSNATHTKKVW